LTAEWDAAQQDRAQAQDLVQSASAAAGTTKSAPPKADPPAALAALQADQLQGWLQTTLARPLFEPGRRPPPGAAPTRVTTAPRLPRLAGVLITPDRRQVIFAGGDGKPIIVGEGATIDGFVVQTITAGQVTVLGPEGAQVLRPSFDPDRRPPQAPLAIAPGIPGLPGMVNTPPAAPPALPRGQMLAAPPNQFNQQ
jgi:hypothetical protein